MKSILKITVGIVLAFILLLGGCIAVVGTAVENSDTGETVDAITSDNKRGGESRKRNDNGDNKVTIKVTGDGTSSASITTTDPNIEQSQDNGASLPWSKTFNVDEIDGIVGFNVVAQNNEAGGNISCEILVNGEQVAQNTSSGQYAVVTCNQN